MDPSVALSKLELLLSRVSFLQAAEWMQVRQLSAQAQPSEVAALLNCYMYALARMPLQVGQHLERFLVVPDPHGLLPLFSLCATAEPLMLLSRPNLLTQELLQGVCRTHQPSLIEYLLSLPEAQVKFWTLAWYVSYYFADLDRSQPQGELLWQLLGPAPPRPARLPNLPPGRGTQAVVPSYPEPRGLLLELLQSGVTMRNVAGFFLSSLREGVSSVSMFIFCHKLNYLSYSNAQRRHWTMDILQFGQLELIIELFKREILVTLDVARHYELNSDSIGAMVLQWLHLDEGYYDVDPMLKWTHLEQLKRLRFEVYFEDSLLTRLLRQL